MTVRVAIVNPVWAPDLHSPEALLDRYESLTGWASAVAAQGLVVTVIQRFFASTEAHRDGVTYRFVADTGSVVSSASRVDIVADVVRAVSADVVHVNGVVFPGWVRALRKRLNPACRLLVQDHGGWHPNRASRLRRWQIRRGLQAAHGLLVSSPGHVDLWRACGLLPPRLLTFDVMESSVSMRPMDRGHARHVTGITGTPSVLWVGRFNDVKDPLTAVEGFSRFLAASPQATLTCVFQGGRLEADVRDRLARDPRVSRRVRLVGSRSHVEMSAFFSAADLLVSASRAEGSGYAVLEGMACGTVPVVTDVPSFRAMTDDGRVGVLWTPGEAGACAAALARAAADCGEGHRARVRARFAEALSWPMIGTRAAGIYRSVCLR